MKSAYELAMERLEKSAPTSPISESKKRAIADIDDLYRAKIAERELFLKGKIAEADFSGDATAAAELRDELRRDVARLKEDAETKKEAVRKAE